MSRRHVSWLASLAVVGACALFLAGGTADAWEEHDDAGRLRLRGAFGPDGSYTLSLFGENGEEGMRLECRANGDSSIALGKGLVISSSENLGRISLSSASGASAVLESDHQSGRLVLRSGDGESVCLRSEGGAAGLTMNTDDNGAHQAIDMIADGKGSRATLSGGDKGDSGVRIECGSSGEKLVSVGTVGVSGVASFYSRAEGTGFSLFDEKRVPRAVVQDNPQEGSGITIMFDNGKPAVQLGVRPAGDSTAKIYGRDGTVISDMAGKK